MSSLEILLLIFAIGFIAGLRSLTAPAAVAWAAHLGWLDSHNSFISFMGSTAAVAAFTALAAFELVGDKLPSVPSRIGPLGLPARILTGGLSGAALAIAAAQPIALGCLLGALGGIAGAFSGYKLRTRLGRSLNVPDMLVALLEDAVAIAGALFIVSRFK